MAFRARAAALLVGAVVVVLLVAALAYPLWASPYERDGGAAAGTTPITTKMGLLSRTSEAGSDFRDMLKKGFAIVEKGLPSAVDLNELTGIPGGTIQRQDTGFSWIPKGSRDTLMPPQARGDRVYSVDVVLTFGLMGGPVYARIAFTDRGDNAGIAQPNSWLYQLDPSVGTALIDLIYRHA